jgi:hypothetical protein
MKYLFCVIAFVLLVGACGEPGRFPAQQRANICERPSLIQQCYDSPECKLNKRELQLWTEHQNTIKEIC